MPRDPLLPRREPRFQMAPNKVPEEMEWLVDPWGEASLAVRAERRWGPPLGVHESFQKLKDEQQALCSCCPMSASSFQSSLCTGCF